MPVPGFLASLSLDGNDITLEVTTTPLERTKNILNKSVMANTGQMESIPGLESGALRITGFLSQAEHNAMEVTWAKDVPVAFLLSVEEGLTTDASWAGFITLGTFSVNPVEDGLWEFALDGETSGPVPYTPSAP